MDLTIIILAAGKGQRMNSELPKVLHPLAGQPMLVHVLNTARSLKPAQIIIVIGHGQDRVTALLPQEHCSWVVQSQQLGTAHAVLQTLPHIKTERTLILFGDVPLLRPETLLHFVKATPDSTLGLLSFYAKDPSGFGRVLRDKHDNIVGVIEERDANAQQRLIKEVASGIYLANTHDLQAWIPAVTPSPISKEYYLPEIIPMAIKAGGVVGSVITDSREALGINNKAQLAIAERVLQKRRVDNLLYRGVTVMDPARLDIRGEVTVGSEVTIDVNVILSGKVSIGDRCLIGANTILNNVTLGADCEILPHSILDGATLANKVTVGPFARIRPGTFLHEEVKVGNFVEVKKSTLGPHTKANHLSYIGDATLGEHVNVGAGTITCNYDGVHKFQTIIGNEVFIGSNSSLVAPVKIGDGATIGAGTVLTKDAPEHQLTLSRAKQTTLAGWQRPEPEPSESTKED